MRHDSPMTSHKALAGQMPDVRRREVEYITKKEREHEILRKLYPSKKQERKTS